MRVIAGRYKRRLLKAVPGQNTRPTTDRNKENLFNLIGPYFDGGVCLDLFGGSGGLGIEALSRGMVKLYSVDVDYRAFQTIKENLTTLGINDACVWKMSAYKALERLETMGEKLDLVLLDPPYGKGHSQRVLEILSQSPLLNPHARIVVEEKQTVHLADGYGNIRKIKAVNYGLTTLHIYEMEEDE